MARIKKKGASGQAKNYITRTQAVRKLQVSLPDFRRLCIFKGIYPREPRNKKKASKTATPNTTFYYTRDIQYLLHEPLLAKFRQHKALSKKIARSLGRGDVSDASRLEKNNAPRMTLDHIVKERYPTFIDALRDLDDCLSLLFLFANLPATTNVPPKVIAQCQRLTQEFQHYLIISHSLRKSFLSIKGIYYQATIQGQDIMWLVPYRFVQRGTPDVDYRIMATFVEFYTTMLGFVNFRLYTSIGLVYPPKYDAKSDERGAELAAFTLEGKKVGDETKAIQAVPEDVVEATPAKEIQDKVNAALVEAQKDNGFDAATEPEQIGKEENENTAVDTFQPVAPEGDVLPQPAASGDEAASLFTPYTVFISREAPRTPIEFLLRAFGCKRVAWDAVLGEGAFTHDELDPRITHQIVDRPPLPESSLPPQPKNPNAENATETAPTVRPGQKVPGRIYVQPQWVWDCINEGRIVRPDLYAPGATLPPHLSPWVKPKQGEYDPRAALDEQEEEGEAERHAEEEEDQGSEDESDNEEVSEGGMNADEAEESEGTEEEKSEKQVKAARKGQKTEALKKKKTDPKSDSPEDEEDSDLDGGMDVDIPGSSDEKDSESESESEIDTFPVQDDEPEEEESGSDEEESARTRHQRELEAEAAGLSFSSTSEKSLKKSKDGKTKKELGPQANKLALKKKKEEEELERQKMMLSRKKRKLFEKMQYSNRKREEEAEKLRKKRRRIEAERKKQKTDNQAGLPIRK
ncbi:mRNA-binding ribosome synthesis protein nop7 [Ascosphaera aggregata]|nr:mRNA-binding ribosome synthesis protein nop7 [Ascosphaera aggregata]